MKLGGEAPWVLAVMWFLTALTLSFVLLRLYARVVLIGNAGADDVVYTLSGILFLFYTIFMHVSGRYGFGQNIADLDLDDAVKAVRWEMIGQTFAVLGMATAKVSLGLFLLRIVIVRWHKIAIWTTIMSLLIVSIMTAIIFWIQCIPIDHLFDPRVGGRCILTIQPFSILLGSWCAAADFFLAGFPWVFIWNLNMKQREKMTIAGSMSLGFLAGICGIVRTIELGGISSKNYTFDTVSLIIWSAAELAVTMVCIGIPVLRPLYRKVTSGGSSSTDRYYKHGQGTDGAMPSDSYNLKKMGGNHIEKTPNSKKMGLHGPSTLTYCERGLNDSDEEILGPEFRHGQTHAPRGGGGGIHVTEDVRVESQARSDRT